MARKWLGVTIPARHTLAKYGWDESCFKLNLANQKYLCRVCEKPLARGRAYIDHEHVAGFSKMHDWQKQRYVRGILCYFCNRFRVCKNTLDSARRVVEYLGKHEAKQNGRADP